MDEQEKNTMVKRLMKEGRLYGWETSPSGLSPAEKYRFVYANAVNRVKYRKMHELNHRFDFQSYLSTVESINIDSVTNKITLQEENYLQKFYYGNSTPEELEKLFLALPDYFTSRTSDTLF